MKKFILFTFLFLLVNISLWAGEKSRFGELNDDDWKAMQEVINRQITAFENDDPAAAFSLASPAIKRRFRTAENFLGMVKLAYPPLYRPRGVAFLDHFVLRGYPMQQVQVIAPDGKVYVARYQMQKQQDGSWRVDGCSLIPTSEELTRSFNTEKVEA